MGEPFRDQGPEINSLIAARQEAIQGISEVVFHDIELDTPSEEVEREISPDTLVSMTKAVETSLEAHHAVRNRVRIVPSDIPEIVDDVIEIFAHRNLIEKTEEEE